MAAIDPFSGQEVYSPNSMGAEVGIGVAQEAGINAPLAFRMAENLPGLPTSMGFSTFRGTNTLIRGGFLDRKTGPIARKMAGRRTSRFRMVDPNTGAISSRQAGNFIGGRKERGFIGRSLGLGEKNNVLTRRAERLMGRPDKSGFARSARLNNFTARPRAFGSYHSLSVFGQDAYTPFSAAKIIGKSSRVSEFFEKRGMTAGEGQSLLGPGLFSFVGAGTKADRLEMAAQKRLASGKALTPRMERKLGQITSNVRSLAGMTNPSIVQDTLQTMSRGEALRMKYGAKGQLGQYAKLKGLSVDQIQSLYPKGQRALVDRAMAQAVGGSLAAGEVSAAGQVGVRGNLLASSAGASGTRYLAGYFRGAKGFGLLRGAAESEADFLARGAARGLSREALLGSEQAIKTFGTGLEKAGISFGGKVGAEAAEGALKGSVFKNLGKKGVLEALGTKGGAKVLGVRAASLAIPGLNVVAAAMMAYDLGQMAGELVKSGINLAKDANKSLKGSISKPLFGMGYQDTEAAATSRSRGVMAIQNSQLNARSALGNEASMMAAHFG